MSAFKTLETYKWPTDEFAFASVGIRMTDLAKRLSTPTKKWQEDGLGSAEGVMIQTEKGFCFLIRELEHAVKYLGSKGPDIFVDAEDFGTHGVEPLLAELLSALNLARSDLTWIQDPAFQKDAKERAISAHAYHRKKA